MLDKLSHALLSLTLALFSMALFAQSAPAEVFEGSMDSGGRERRFQVILPDGMKPGQRLPTVIALHGALMSGKSMSRIFGMDELARGSRVAVVYPDGLRRRWNDGRTGSADGPNDVRFIRQLADRLVQDGVADPKRLYLVGVSNGGMLAFRIACEAPGIFAAYAAVIATMPSDVAETCPRAGSAPFLIINSTEDRVVPWEGGEIGPLARRGSVLSTPETVEFWRRHNRCKSQAEVKPLPDKDQADGSTVMAKQFAECESGSPVVLLTVEGGGHLPPGAQIGNRPFLRSMLGAANQDISAADVSLKFFKRFPLPR